MYLELVRFLKAFLDNVGCKQHQLVGIILFTQFLLDESLVGRKEERPEVVEQNSSPNTQTCIS